MWTQMIMDGENKIAALAINNKDGEALNIIDPEVFPAILSLPSPILSLSALELNPFLCWPRLSAEERPTCLAAPGKTDKECWALWASVLALDYNLLYLVHRAHAHATHASETGMRSIAEEHEAQGSTECSSHAGAPLSRVRVECKSFPLSHAC